MTIKELDRLILFGKQGMLTPKEVKAVVQNDILEHREKEKKIQQQLMDILNDLL